MKFLVLLLSLFFSFTAFAEQTDYAGQITQLKNQLDSCWNTFKRDYKSQKYEYPKNSMSDVYHDHQKTCSEAFECYQKISDHLFDTYYPDTKDLMKKNMKAFIDAQLEIYEYGYSQNKLCLPACGRYSDIYAQTDTLTSIHIYLLNLVEYIEKMYQVKGYLK